MERLEVLAFESRARTCSRKEICFCVESDHGGRQKEQLNSKNERLVWNYADFFPAQTWTVLRKSLDHDFGIEYGGVNAS
jgi:hypothetical protein